MHGGKRWSHVYKWRMRTNVKKRSIGSKMEAWNPWAKMNSGYMWTNMNWGRIWPDIYRRTMRS